MKTKQFTTKLTLNKKTVSNLDSHQMSNLKGGVHITTRTNPLYNTDALECTFFTCKDTGCPHSAICFP